MDDYLVGLEEHNAFHYATDAEFDRAGAAERGSVKPEQAWILSDRDCWYPNPYYAGPPVPHPEDERYDD